jgi:energy-coupling factor transporter ATP-binding protein EcfA2
LNTIIFSTHDIELAAELADSIYVMGYPKRQDGSMDSIGTIVKHFDLKEIGVAWQPEFTPQHLEVVKEVKAVLLDS